MKSFILLIKFLALGISSFSQSNYAEGFKEGYKNGYCYEKHNCVGPIAPPAPIPSIGENSDSYQDGYNRGFKMGLDAQKGGSSNSKRGYKTASADPIDYTYKPNQSKIQENVANNRDAIFEKIIAKAQEYYDQADYGACINACNDAMQITNLVSKQCYTLLANSYQALGKKGKAKRYFKKAENFN
jgi:hypothetical protein